jgi:hypothetical protein
MIDSILKMAAAGGSDRYEAGTYSVVDGTLKSPVLAFTVLAEAVITSCKERRFSKTLNKISHVNYAAKFCTKTLTVNEVYLMEYPLSEIVIASGVIQFHHVPTGRNTDFTTTAAPTTTIAPTTTGA